MNNKGLNAENIARDILNASMIDCQEGLLRWERLEVVEADKHAKGVKLLRYLQAKYWDNDLYGKVRSRAGNMVNTHVKDGLGISVKRIELSLSNHLRIDYRCDYGDYNLSMPLGASKFIYNVRKFKSTIRAGSKKLATHLGYLPRYSAYVYDDDTKLLLLDNTKLHTWYREEWERGALTKLAPWSSPSVFQAQPNILHSFYVSLDSLKASPAFVVEYDINVLTP